MGFKLRPDGVDDYVLLEKPINVNLGKDTYTVKLKVAVSEAINTYILGQNQITQSNVLSLLANGRMQVSSGGAAAWFSNAGFILFDSNPHEYLVEHDSNGQMRFFRDGEIFQTRTYNTDMFLPVPFNTLFRLSASTSTSTFSSMDFYYLHLTGFINSGKWNPSIVLANPTILVDENGVNNGTLKDFPLDGSARIYYDDGVSLPTEESRLKLYRGSAFAPITPKVYRNGQWVSAVVRI